jgi:sugar lactone lactonase YvrE
MGSSYLLAGFVFLGYADPTITTVAGTGERGYAGDGGPATKARLDNPFHPAFDKDGNLYFSDTNNHVVRRVDSKTGIITTVAGSGKKGYSGDGGPATKATFNEPYGICLSKEGDLFIVDRLNHCIRYVEAKTGDIKTLAGNGITSFRDDDEQLKKEAFFREPNGITIRMNSVLFIADVKDQRIRIINLQRKMIGTASGSGEAKIDGDGGPFEMAKHNGPRALCVDKAQDFLFIVEREGNCVRKVDFSTDGKITRFAGTGQKGYTGDGGPALKATFDGPKEVCCDKAGNVFIVDTENEVIRRIDAKTGIITTVAGKGKSKTPGLGDGGPATQATLGRPHGVAVGPDGGLYIADTLSNKIRVVK